jgi:hypothetical protein
VCCFALIGDSWALALNFSTHIVDHRLHSVASLDTMAAVVITPAVLDFKGLIDIHG